MADSKPDFKPVKFCSRRFGFVVLIGGLLAVQDYTFAYGGMGKRKNAFNDEFMKANFEQYHKLTVDKDAPVPKMGYPDVGAGMYSRQLPYKDWYEFNIYQRIHGNSIEHLSWFLPLLFVQGVFMPRFSATMAGVVLLGRELYRFGYLTKEGPSSPIRELGAVPLNAAEFLVIGSVSFYLFKRYSGNFFANRKIVKYFTHNHYDRRMEEIIKKANLAKKGLAVRKPAMLPMHPSILENTKQLGEKMTPLEKKRYAEQNRIPDIGSHM